MKPTFRILNNGAHVRVQKFIKGFPEASTGAARVLGEAFLKTLKSSIETQSLGLAPLSESWTRTKAARGLDPRILMATKEYISSMVLTPVGQGKFAVEADGERFKLLEYGTRSMPARPHFRPAVKAARAAKPQAIEVFRDLLGR